MLMAKKRHHTYNDKSQLIWLKHKMTAKEFINHTHKLCVCRQLANDHVHSTSLWCLTMYSNSPTWRELWIKLSAMISTVIQWANVLMLISRFHIKTNVSTILLIRAWHISLQSQRYNVQARTESRYIVLCIGWILLHLIIYVRPRMIKKEAIHIFVSILRQKIIHWPLMGVLLHLVQRGRSPPIPSSLYQM